MRCDDTGFNRTIILFYVGDPAAAKGIVNMWMRMHIRLLAPLINVRHADQRLVELFYILRIDLDLHLVAGDQGLAFGG